MVVLLAAETIAARPHSIPFFNFLAGGAKGGIDLLADSNLDWGQGLPALRRWMAERNVPRVNLSYFGSADPAAYGISFVPLAGSFHMESPGARSTSTGSSAGGSRRPQSAAVTRSTSSIVVSPAAALVSPLCRSVFMPPAIAVRLSSSALTPPRICSRSSSLIGMTS